MILDRAPAGPLSDHLDVVVTGQTAPSSGLDPALAATVERFFAADDAPAPPPGLADRLWVELLRNTAPTHGLPSAVAPQPRPDALPPLAFPEPDPPRDPVPLRWARAQLATAALVLLVLLGTLLVTRGPLRLIGPEDQPASIPAMEAPEVAAVAEALITTWPAENPPFWASVQRITLDPGAVEGVYATDATGIGLDLFTVESGQVAVDADGPVVVTRGSLAGGAEPTTAPEGTTIVLEEGDQLFVPADVTFTRRNTASTQSTTLDFQIVNVEPMHKSPGVRYERLLPDRILNTVPPAPARAALHRLRLLPGSRLLVSDLPGLQLLFVEEGTLDLIGVRAPGDLVPVTWSSIPAGRGLAHFDTTPEVANRSTEPVTFLVATLAPAD